MKRGKMSKAELNYIATNRIMLVEQLAKDLDRSEDLVQKLVDALPPVEAPKPKEMSADAQFMRGQVSRGRIKHPNRADKTIGNVMTAAMSQTADEQRIKNQPGQSRYTEGSIYKPFDNTQVNPSDSAKDAEIAMLKLKIKELESKK